MENIVKMLGFDNVKQMNRMVSMVDILTPEKAKAFQQWKEEDGTKEGLCKLLPDGHADCKQI